ncbi:hypothetical protein NIES3585_02040 [Nodularia sp. NIES-3585]|nr:hypothetical protein NIES3585_02040 [Nodularia sp. NIES-3585]
MGSGEWGVGSGLKPFWCLSLIIRLCLNLLGGCHILVQVKVQDANYSKNQELISWKQEENTGEHFQS